MWGNDKVSTNNVDTLIGQHSCITGDVVFKGGLHVDGLIKGNVHADSSESAVLVLSEKGTIEGQVNVPYVVVNGTIIGDIHADVSVELASKARVKGDVYYTKIEMAMGAEVNGNLVHIEEAVAPLKAVSGGKEKAAGLDKS